MMEREKAKQSAREAYEKAKQSAREAYEKARQPGES